VAQRLRGGAGDDGPAIPRELALRWLREAAAALDAAHAAGVVHRDVKPHNLLLDGEDRLAVADFGIATLASETSLTQTGMVLGTAAYLSPEQRAGHTATPASDRYSLAVVAKELLPGAAPGVIARGLAEDPEQRPPSATAFVDELEGALTPRAPAPPPTAPTRVLPSAQTALQRTHSTKEAGGAAPSRPAATTPRPADRRRRPSLPFLVALSALLLAGALAIALASGGGDDSRRAATTPETRATTAEKQKPQSQPKPEEPAKPKPQPRSSPTPRQLNDLGFAKLPGDPAGAIPLLRRSVEGFRAQGATGDINYAFALFNLGNALRLAGDPAAAIPYLEERLRISDFKRGVVKRELALAREQAGLVGSGEGDKPGKDEGEGGDD
jgi:serine/threonine-protein kinase